MRQWFAGLIAGFFDGRVHMGTFSVFHWLIILLVAFLWIFPLWKIIERTGRPGAIALIAIIPLLGLVLLWWIAFARWPSQNSNAPGSTVAHRP